MSAPRHKVGDVVGQWTLLEYIPGKGVPHKIEALWRCRCSCGQEREVQGNHIVSRRSTSCGCVGAATTAARLKTAPRHARGFLIAGAANA